MRKTSETRPSTAETFLDGADDQGRRHESDEELIIEYSQTQNREAFEELVHRHEHDLYIYLRNYLGHADLAEDAFQTTLLQLHLKCGQFEPGRRLRPWLYTIATRQAINLLRRNRRHRSVRLNGAVNDSSGNPRNAFQDLLESPHAGPHEEAEAAEERKRLRFAVERLPARFREVLFLVVYKGLRYREAAEALGVPLGTIKSRVHTAVETLQQELIAAHHLSPRVAPRAMIH